MPLSVSDLAPTGPCHKALLALPRPIPIGTFVPTCEDDGYYSPQQTWGSTGESWCVTREGKEIAGTRTSPGQPPYDCNKGTPVVFTGNESREGSLGRRGQNNGRTFGGLSRSFSTTPLSRCLFPMKRNGLTTRVDIEASGHRRVQMHSPWYHLYVLVYFYRG